MMFQEKISQRIIEATSSVFGESEIALAVRQACERYEHEVDQIDSSRGINALLIAIVGAKGQGKTWSAKQFLFANEIRDQLRSGDLTQDATTRLVWVGPVHPDQLDPSTESFYPCQADQMLPLGQTYVILDTPGLTDANQLASTIAHESLALAPVKLLVIARDQIRAAANITLAHQIDGSFCIPVITSVEPTEFPDQPESHPLENDIKQLRDQLSIMAPRTHLGRELLIPDFDITDDEAAAAEVFRSGIRDRLESLGLSATSMTTAREMRLSASAERLKTEIARIIQDQLPQLSEAVDQLHRETQQLPTRVLNSLMGSDAVLLTGIRMQLRTRLASETSLLWFPYRTVLSTLNLTQGAWDRVVLMLSGSIPSLFGALASWTKNVRQSREFDLQIQNGIREHTQKQVEERLGPLCDQFHRTVMHLRPRSDRERASKGPKHGGMRLMGIEELQSRSQKIFQTEIERSATKGWLTQLYAVIGVVIFWSLMAGPIVVIYRGYLTASAGVFSGEAIPLEDFPYPTPGLLFTSLLLSILPLAIYCMIILTWTLSHRKTKQIAARVISKHESAIEELYSQGVIRLTFEDELLEHTEYLLNVSGNGRSTR